MIETSIRAILAGTTPITTVVGTRIRPVNQGQDDEKPYIVYQVIDGEDFDTLDAAAEWRREIVQIDVYADTYREAESLARLVKTALHYQQITVDRGTDGMTELVIMQQAPFQNLTPPAVDGEGIPAYRLSSDFRCTFRETV